MNFYDDFMDVLDDYCEEEVGIYYLQKQTVSSMAHAMMRLAERQEVSMDRVNMILDHTPVEAEGEECSLHDIFRQEEVSKEVVIYPPPRYLVQGILNTTKDVPFIEKDDLLTVMTNIVIDIDGFKTVSPREKSLMKAGVFSVADTLDLRYELDIKIDSFYFERGE